MFKLRSPRWSAFFAAAALLALPAAARAQGSISGVTPRFAFGPAYAAPLGGQPGGSTVTWQGADNGSLAVFPDGKTTFWAFGDTFLAPSGYGFRTNLAPAVVNTIAIGVVGSNGNFNPTYYYRGSLDYDANNNTTNNASSFFLDPDRYSDSPNITPNTAKDAYPPNNANNPLPNLGNGPNYYTNPLYPYMYNTDCSRFWTGKAIFWNPGTGVTNVKLFVFLNRVDYSGALLLGNYVARVENPCNAVGGANDPSLWNISYLKLSGVSTAGWTQPTDDPARFPNPRYIKGDADNPTIGAEAFIGADPGDAQPSMFAFASVATGSVVPKNTIVKIPMAALLSPNTYLNNPPNQTFSKAYDISSTVQYMSSATGQWTYSGVYDRPVPLTGFRDADIPAGGGFTCRLLPGPNNTPGNTWRNVYIDAGAPQTIRLRTSTVGPFGPWSAPQTAYTIPELNPANTPFDPFAPAIDGYNKGIYSQGMASSNGPKCYMGYEIYPFASAANPLVMTFSNDRGSVPPPYPPNCNPGTTGWLYWDNNFYVVKAVAKPLP